MTEHTDGPWRVKYETRIEYGPFVAGEGFCVGTVKRDPPEWKANARLIANAPETAAERDRLKAINAELLVALNEMMREFEPDQADYDDGSNYNPPDWLVLARDVVAKAT